jgi:hypothetical protein
MRVTATLSGWELLLRRNTHHDRFTIMSNLKFLHFPVAAKAVLLIAALGLLSIAANWFCLERLDEFDRLNATLTRHLAPARLALAEAKAASESFGVAVYKDYSASDPDQAKESVEEMEGQYNAARRALSNVLAAYPAATDDVRRIFDKLEFAHGIAVEIGRSAKSGQTQQAERLVNFKFDPARDDVTGHMGLCWGHYLSFLDLVGPFYLLYGEQETVCGGLDLHHMGTCDPEIDSGFC